MKTFDVSRRALYAICTVCFTSSVTLVAAIFGLRAHAEPAPSVPTAVTSGDTLTADVLNTHFAATRALLNQINDPMCPIGYVQDTSITTFVDCKRGSDDLVRVGAGASAYWIDRFEASVWTSADGTGTQYGATSPTYTLVTDYPASFPKTGQRAPSTASFSPLYAVSKAGTQPSGSLTWFQALEVCAASGKRLPVRQEWLRAASGTIDPGNNDGVSGACATVGGTGPHTTGQGTACVSAWGAQDMIGSMWEWTDEWYMGLKDEPPPTGVPSDPSSNWPAEYGADGTYNISSSAYGSGGTTRSPGIPAAAVRGGADGNGTFAGIFALNLNSAPTNWAVHIGFRCVRPR
jgi:formylglycine-generating enzyme required for sulfatase activity